MHGTLLPEVARYSAGISKNHQCTEFVLRIESFQYIMRITHRLHGSECYAEVLCNRQRHIAQGYANVKFQRSNVTAKIAEWIQAVQLLFTMALCAL